jgi:carnitine 3-dehydrogenase
MDANTEISRVAIVGTGLIGGSWAACFLAHGLDVVATGRAPGKEDKVRQYVEAAWPALTKIGLAPGASTTRLRFTADLKEAVAGKRMFFSGPDDAARFLSAIDLIWNDCLWFWFVRSR